MSRLPIWRLEHNTSRALGNPFRFRQLLQELGEVAPHRCKLITIDFSPEHQEWYFYWGVPKLWEMVFCSSHTPTKLEEAWAFFGPLASELECFPVAHGRGFLESTILAIIEFYKTGKKPDLVDAQHQKPAQAEGVPND